MTASTFTPGPFTIGDTVYCASFERRTKQVKCPDCLGTKALSVTLGDGETTYKIPCAGCSLGFDPPRGFIEEAIYEPRADARLVVGVESNRCADGTIEYSYRFAGNWYADQDRTFSTESEAIRKSFELKAEHEADENQRLAAKTKDHRKWSWHVHYYRRQIKDAEATIERAQKQLGIAVGKAKDARARGES